MAELRLENVTKTFGGEPVLEDVSLRIADGELLVIVGPSGCGKSTLLRILAGLDTPTEGDVYVDGERVTDVPARDRDVALAFQELALFPHLDVRRNLGFNVRIQGADNVAERVEATAETLGIADLLDRSIDELSGGQRQRVALGRVLASDATAYLLDEPFESLDARLRERMRTEVARIQQQLGTTTVHVTHDQGEALAMGDRIALLWDGEVQQVGTPRELYTEPRTRSVAEFIGTPSMNFLPGEYDPAAERVVIPGDGREVLTLPVSTAGGTERVEVGVRPADLAAVRDEGGDSAVSEEGKPACDEVPTRGTDSTTKVVSATVDYVEYGGSDAYAYLDADGLPELVARVDGETELEADASATVGIPVERLHVFDARSGNRLSRADADPGGAGSDGE